MKNDTELNTEHNASMFPITVSVRGIKSINYLFDPETLKPWSNTVVEYNDVIKTKNITGSSVLQRDIVISEKQHFQQLIQMSRQLIEDYGKFITKNELSSDLDLQLQCSALLIYLAKCWEDWAFQIYALCSPINKDAADRQLASAYNQYIIPYYREAIGGLENIGKSLPLDIKDETRLAWGKMTIYARDKLLAIVPLYKSEDTIRCEKEYYKNSDEWLVKNGLAHLVPNYKPKVEDNTNFVDSAKELIWSAWSGITNFCGITQQQNYQQIPEVQSQNNHKPATPEVKDMSRDAVLHSSDEEEHPGLKKRKGKNLTP